MSKIVKLVDLIGTEIFHGTHCENACKEVFEKEIASGSPAIIDTAGMKFVNGVKNTFLFEKYSPYIIFINTESTSKDYIFKTIRQGIEKRQQILNNEIKTCNIPSTPEDIIKFLDSKLSEDVIYQIPKSSIYESSYRELEITVAIFLLATSPNLNIDVSNHIISFFNIFNSDYWSPFGLADRNSYILLWEQTSMLVVNTCALENGKKYFDIPYVGVIEERDLIRMYSLIPADFGRIPASEIPDLVHVKYKAVERIKYLFGQKTKKKTLIEKLQTIGE